MRQIFTYIILFSSLMLNAQMNPNCDVLLTQECEKCKCLIDKGDCYAQSSDYDKAIKKYNAAVACDEGFKNTIEDKLLKVFNLINGEKEKAKAAEAEAKIAQTKAEKAEIEAKKQADIAKVAEEQAKDQKKIAEEQTQLAEDKTENLQKVLDELYFYKDSFALAYDGYDFGFINKKGDVLIGHKYDEALPFDYTGYAKVKKGNTYYLIDTDENDYRMTDDIKQLDENIEAFDFRNQKNKYAWRINLKSDRYISPFPPKVQKNILQRRILRNTQLKILLLSNFGLKKLLPEIGQLSNLKDLDLRYNKLTELPAEIGQLSNLQSLSLWDNQLTTLPAEIGQLSNLQSLSLRGNNLSKEEKQKIKKLLPNCDISF